MSDTYPMNFVTLPKMSHSEPVPGILTTGSRYKIGPSFIDRGCGLPSSRPKAGIQIDLILGLGKLQHVGPVEIHEEDTYASAHRP